MSASGNSFSFAHIIGLLLCLSITCSSSSNASSPGLSARKEEEVKLLRLKIKKLLMDDADTATALEKCDEAIKAFPEIGGFYFDRANIFVLMNEPDKALADFKLASFFDSKLQAECAFSSAEIYRRQGRKDFALKELDEIPEQEKWNENQRDAFTKIRALLQLGQKEKARVEYIKLRDLYRARKAARMLTFLKSSFPQFSSLTELRLKAPEADVPKVLAALKQLTDNPTFPTIAQIEDATGVTLERKKPQFEGDDRFDGTKEYLYVQVEQQYKRVNVYVNGYVCAVSRQNLLDGKLIVGDAKGKYYTTNKDYLISTYVCTGVYDSLRVCSITWTTK